jgi:molecular chaperone GrpE
MSESDQAHDAAAGPSDSTEDEDPAAAEARQFETDLNTLQRERDDLLDTTRRLQADFENYRKRVMREQTALVARATEGLVELVFAELTSVLEKAGLERIDALGAPFDPNEHEAVLQDDGDGEPHVGDVMRAGWKLKGRVLRPAMVKVSRSEH